MEELIDFFGRLLLRSYCNMADTNGFDMDGVFAEMVCPASHFNQMLACWEVSLWRLCHIRFGTPTYRIFSDGGLLAVYTSDDIAVVAFPRPLGIFEAPMLNHPANR